MTLTVTERGWTGHFILGRKCRYHRNTLISHGARHIVVSSVGDLHDDALRAVYGQNKEEPQPVGPDRIGETYLFHGISDPGCDPACISVDVERQISYPGDDGIPLAPSFPVHKADAIHDAAVAWVRANWTSLTPPTP